MSAKDEQMMARCDRDPSYLLGKAQSLLEAWLDPDTNLKLLEAQTAKFLKALTEPTDG